MKNAIRKALSSFLFKVLRLNPDTLVNFAYYNHNIRPGFDNKTNGELYLLEKVKRFYAAKEKVTVFDVGANDGSYSVLVSQIIPNADVYAFEPNYELIKKSDFGSAKVFPVGLGEQPSEMNLYFSEKYDQMASVYKGVSDYHEGMKDNYEEKVLKIRIETLMDVCERENVSRIDFLKIDTEGYEMSVLLGGKEMLLNDRIGVIQFEFNEMNVFSRVFLKDFYELMGEKYEFYRLHKQGLFPLGKYNAHNEIFVWHNLVAVNKTLAGKFAHTP